MASFDPRGLIGRIYVGTTRRALDITSYLYNMWASWFQRRFLKFFPNIILSIMLYVAIIHDNKFHSNQSFPLSDDALHEMITFGLTLLT